jgi:hypothetical protein
MPVSKKRKKNGRAVRPAQLARGGGGLGVEEINLVSALEKLRTDPDDEAGLLLEHLCRLGLGLDPDDDLLVVVGGLVELGATRLDSRGRVYAGSERLL